MSVLLSCTLCVFVLPEALSIAPHHSRTVCCHSTVLQYILTDYNSRDLHPPFARPSPKTQQPLDPSPEGGGVERHEGVAGIRRKWN